MLGSGRATLALFGHAIDGDPDQIEADVIEHWYDGALTPTAALAARASVVHLVRAGRAVGAVAPGDRVLQLGSPDVAFDRVLDAVAAAPPRVW